MKRYILFFILSTLFTLSSIILRDNLAEAKNYERITILGETAKGGVFDPSIEYGEDGRIGWMAYSAVEDFPKGVSTHIAKTSDHGKSWEKVLEVNISEEGVVEKDGVKIKGVWRNEVPTLVYDPQDPVSARRWKLFWHKYFAVSPYIGPKHRLVEYGWIAYKYAPTPSGPWSEEIPLFGAGKFPKPPFFAKYNLNSFHPDLAKVVAYTEPAAFYWKGYLYLALQGLNVEFYAPTSGKVKEPHLFPKGRVVSKIFLFASANHGESWKYIGVLLDENDAHSLGCAWLTAPSLADDSGKVFLLVSPSLRQGFHNGTYIFEVEDIKKAYLRRDNKGKVVIYKYLPPSIEGNAGESDYDKYNTYGGVIMSQADLACLKLKGSAGLLQIFNTKIKIINKR